MDTEASLQSRLQTEIAELRERFPGTQDLYREVCVLLFFRHGITPTANKLYQLVHKGSMSAPAEALAKFWADLREKSRVRLEHPDLPEDLKTLAGDLVGTLWMKAQALARESVAALRDETHAAARAAEAAQAQAEAARDGALDQLRVKTTQLEAAEARGRDLEQALARETATRVALDAQLGDARQAALDRQTALAAARRDFAAELEKLREALKITEERYQAAEARAHMETDRERTLAARLQKDLDAARTQATEATSRYQAEARSLQQDLGDQKQRIGHLEGELTAVSGTNHQLQAELCREREVSRDLSVRLSSLVHEVELWQHKAIEAHGQLETLRATKKRKTGKGSGQMDLTSRGTD